MSDQSLLEFRGVERRYGEGDSTVFALAGVDLTIKEGEFVAIMGSSGSGKSTAMNVLGCLDSPTAGTYLFRGVPVEKLGRDGRALLRRHQIGFVFQGFNLLPRTSAVDNVELPLVYRRVNAAERRQRALAALESVGLAGRERHTPSQLSGGQQQRVAIARALVTEPSLLLADEPTGNLDSARSIELITLIRNLNTEKNLTIVMVTHEPEIAEFAKRRLVFKDGLIIEDTGDKR